MRVDIHGMPHTPQTPAFSGQERRRNPRLRELVDEMLASIRVAANKDFWTTEERARCQDDMARIMASVRDHAVELGAPTKS
jgi:hypothetical protein